MLDGFKKSGWVAIQTGSEKKSYAQDMMAAEILHIMYGQEKGLARSNANTTIGGQFKGYVLKYTPKLTSEEKNMGVLAQDIGELSIHIGDRIDN